MSPGRALPSLTLGTMGISPVALGEIPAVAGYM